MKFFRKRKRYLFGATRQTVTVRMFEQRTGKHTELFLEFSMTKDGEWVSVGTIPLIAMESATEAMKSCAYQLNHSLKR